MWCNLLQFWETEGYKGFKKATLFGRGFLRYSCPGGIETSEWWLAVLLGSGRKILFNVSTITLPGVIYSGMLMCLESTGPCGLWHGLRWAFLSSIRSGIAQALRCRCHLFKQQRLMQQDPDLFVQKACLSAFTHSAHLCLCLALIWRRNMHFRSRCILIFASLSVEICGLLGMHLTHCKHYLCVFPASGSVLYVMVWISTTQLQDVNGPLQTYETHYFSTLI